MILTSLCSHTEVSVLIVHPVYDLCLCEIVKFLYDVTEKKSHILYIFLLFMTHTVVDRVDAWEMNDWVFMVHLSILRFLKLIRGGHWFNAKSPSLISMNSLGVYGICSVSEDFVGICCILCVCFIV